MRSNRNPIQTNPGTIDSNSNESWDDWLNPAKSDIFAFLPVLGELSRSSRDSFESDSDSKESWDDRLNSFKSGVSKFLRFFEYRIDRTYRTQSVSIVSIEGRLVRWSVDDDGPFGLEKWFLMIFGRTDLRISLSGTRFDEEADFDVRSAVGPPKPHQIHEKLIFRSDNFAENVFSASKNRKLQIF